MKEKWTELFTRVCRHKALTSFGEKTEVSIRKKHNTEYLFTEKDAGYYRVQIHTENALCAEFHFVPWAEFTFLQGDDHSLMFKPDLELLCVTDFAVVFEQYVQPNDTCNTNNTKDFLSELLTALNIEALDTLQEEELTIPEHVQEISHKVYPKWVDLEIAVPGSRLPEPEKWKHVCKNRMLRISLIPDHGRITTLWMPSEAEAGDIEDDEELRVVNILDNAFRDMLKKDGEKKRAYEKANRELRDLFPKNTRGNKLYQKYELRLFRWLGMKTEDFSKGIYPREETVFGGYQPKKTPDTAQDYMPELHTEFAVLPAASSENAESLLQSFFDYRKQAQECPGRWEEGNPLLGAKPKEYLPSKEELLLEETGKRVSAVFNSLSGVEKNNLLNKTGFKEKQLEYNEFRFVHVDIMGSGRFFYVEEIIPKQIL
ncbi:MAG: hypothetical protein ACLFR1_09790 [Spirochaetia bacterium]